MRDRLTEISGRRSQFADELRNLVSDSRAAVSTDAHYGGILHRGWVDLETRIRPESDGHLIEECRRGEEGTLKHFESALAREEFPAGARQLVEQQRERIRGDLARLGKATYSAAGTSL